MATTLHSVSYYNAEADLDIYCESEVSDLCEYPEVIAIRSVIPGSACFLHTADAAEITRIERELYRNAALKSRRYA